MKTIEIVTPNYALDIKVVCAGASASVFFKDMRITNALAINEAMVIKSNIVTQLILNGSSFVELGTGKVVSSPIVVPIMASCRIIKGLGENTVVGVDESGIEHVLFNYYPDELRFTENEFLGKTVEFARDLFMKRSIAYLRS